MDHVRRTALFAATIACASAHIQFSLFGGDLTYIHDDIERVGKVLTKAGIDTQSRTKVPIL